MYSRYRTQRPKREPLSSEAFFKRFVKVCGVLLLLIALVAAPLWALVPLEIDRRTVYISQMPPQFKNLKIAFASDFHYSPSQSGLSLRAVKKLNALGADIIILGGDYGRTPEDAAAFFRSMPRLSAHIGVFAVLGESDSSGEMPTDVIAAMKEAGIIPLVNAYECIKIGNHSLYVAGLDDYDSGRCSPDAIVSHVQPQDTVIVACHTPSALPFLQTSQSSSHWYDVLLCGHTHGAQVRLGSLALLPELVEDIPPRYYSGFLEENRAALLISNGVGYTRLPARLFATPQIHLLTLKPR